MKDRVEALLFAAGRFIDEDHLVELLQEDKRVVKKALLELKDDYDDRKGETCLQIINEDNSWKMHVREEYLDLVSKLVSDKEIAKTVLETLAVIAWKTPMLQADVIKIRGPAAYEHIGELIERGFVTKEPSGRTFKLKVTDKFFDYFDVEGREDIRSMFKHVEAEAEAQQAEVDRDKQAYEEKKAEAEAVAAEIGDGVNPLESRDIDGAPSAQTLNDEDRPSGGDSDGDPAIAGELRELKRDVMALGEDIADMRDEEKERLGEEDDEDDSEDSKDAEKKPKPHPKHHAAHKKHPAHHKTKHKKH